MSIPNFVRWSTSLRGRNENSIMEIGETERTGNLKAWEPWCGDTLMVLDKKVLVLDLRRDCVQLNDEMMKYISSRALAYKGR